jgi:hypothetical protein
MRTGRYRSKRRARNAVLVGSASLLLLAGDSCGAREESAHPSPSDGGASPADAGGAADAGALPDGGGAEHPDAGGGDGCGIGDAGLLSIGRRL